MQIEDDAPRVYVEIELEGVPRLRLDASTAEDELRLRRWLLEATHRISSEITELLRREAA